MTHLKIRLLKNAVGIFKIIVILAVAVAIGYLIGARSKNPAKITTPKNIYITFLSEVFSKIKENYWDKLSDEQLANLYVLGAEKLTGQIINSKPKNKNDLEKLLTKTITDIKEDQKKKEFAAGLSDMVLANLQPFGRSRLYSKKEEVGLKNQVENRDPAVDLYKALGVKKEAAKNEIEKVYNEKTKELEKESSPEAQQKLTMLNRAHQVLTNEKSRETYNKSGVEPTIKTSLLKPDIFYLHITKFSPTTMDELINAVKEVDKNDALDIFILDLRDNIGGAIDSLPYFLGPFIGSDQYAYQFLHQGEKSDYKTRTGWLPSLIRYKKVVVLINENAQSTAEVMASVLKKYNVGILIGSTSKGWGTVEKVFPLDTQIDPHEKYSIFLVHSLTLREDGQPIEGKGVDPVISLKDPNWEKQLYSYFHYPELAEAIKEVLK